MQSLRVGISPVLGTNPHADGISCLVSLYFIAAKAARVAFPPRIEITGLPRSRTFPCTNFTAIKLLQKLQQVLRLRLTLLH